MQSGRRTLRRRKDLQQTNGLVYVHRWPLGGVVGGIWLLSTSPCCVTLGNNPHSLHIAPPNVFRCVRVGNPTRNPSRSVLQPCDVVKARATSAVLCTQRCASRARFPSADNLGRSVYTTICTRAGFRALATSHAWPFGYLYKGPYTPVMILYVSLPEPWQHEWP